jgi:hypothetical protein
MAKATPIIQSQDPSISIADLDHLRSKIHHHVHSLLLKGPLKFVGYPTIDGPYVHPDEDGLLAINSGPQMLEPHHPMNQSLLTFQNDLIMLMKEACTIETHSIGEITKEKRSLCSAYMGNLIVPTILKRKNGKASEKATIMKTLIHLSTQVV